MHTNYMHSLFIITYEPLGRNILETMKSEPVRDAPALLDPELCHEFEVLKKYIYALRPEL